MVPMVALSRLVRIAAIALFAVALIGCSKPPTPSPAHAKERAELQRYWAAEAPAVADLVQALDNFGNPLNEGENPSLSAAQHVEQVLGLRLLTSVGIDKVRPPTELATAHGELRRALHRSLNALARRAARGQTAARQIAAMRTAIAGWEAQMKHRARQLGMPLTYPSPQRLIPV